MISFRGIGIGPGSASFNSAPFALFSRKMATLLSAPRRCRDRLGRGTPDVAIVGKVALSGGSFELLGRGPLAFERKVAPQFRPAVEWGLQGVDLAVHVQHRVWPRGERDIALARG
jgi:hypothetical protein